MKHTCDNCSCEYSPTHPDQKYCSHACAVSAPDRNRRLSESHTGKYKHPIDRALLEELYSTQRLTIKQCADHLGVSPGTIRIRLHRYRIRVRTKSETKKGALNPRYGKPGTMRGRKHSSETREKLSQHLRENPRSYWKGKKRSVLDPSTMDKLQAGKAAYLEEYAKENKVETSCAVCGKTFEYYPRHQAGRCCSRACTAILGNRSIKKRGAPPTKTEEKQCRHCGATFTATGYRQRRRQFCSPNCFRRWNKKYQREHPQESLYRAKNGFREDLQQYFRSSWEANIARYFDHIGMEWEFEPKRFMLIRQDGSKCHYWPDFWVKGEGYVEIKGYEHPRGMSKIELFSAQYPDLPLSVIDADAYRAIESEHAELIEDWEVTPFQTRK